MPNRPKFTWTLPWLWAELKTIPAVLYTESVEPHGDAGMIFMFVALFGFMALFLLIIALLVPFGWVLWAFGLGLVFLYDLIRFVGYVQVTSDGE